LEEPFVVDFVVEKYAVAIIIAASILALIAPGMSPSVVLVVSEVTLKDGVAHFIVLHSETILL
jgi:hypothetical protein